MIDRKSFICKSVCVNNDRMKDLSLINPKDNQQDIENQKIHQ